MKKSVLLMMGLLVVATSSCRVANMAIIYSTGDEVSDIMLRNQALPLAFLGAMQSQNTAVLTNGLLVRALLFLLTRNESEARLIATSFEALQKACAQRERLVDKGTASAEAKRTSQVDDEMERCERLVFDYYLKHSLSSASDMAQLLYGLGRFESVMRTYPWLNPFVEGLSFAQGRGYAGLSVLTQFARDINLARWDLFAVMVPHYELGPSRKRVFVDYRPSEQRMVLFLPKTMDWLLPGFNVDLQEGDYRYGKYAFLHRLPTDTPAQVNESIKQLIEFTEPAVDAPATIAATIGSIFNPTQAMHDDLSWNFYLLGHGKPSTINQGIVPAQSILTWEGAGKVAGMPTPQFLRLLSKFLTLNTHIVLYETCYGGGFHAVAAGDIAILSNIVSGWAVPVDRKKQRPIIVSLAAEEETLHVYERPDYNNFFARLVALFDGPQLDSDRIKNALRGIVNSIQDRPALVLMPDARTFEFLDPKNQYISRILRDAVRGSEAGLNMLLSINYRFAPHDVAGALRDARKQDNARLLLKSLESSDLAQVFLLEVGMAFDIDPLKLLTAEMYNRNMLSMQLLNAALKILYEHQNSTSSRKIDYLLDLQSQYMAEMREKVRSLRTRQNWEGALDLAARAGLPDDVARLCREMREKGLLTNDVLVRVLEPIFDYTGDEYQKVRNYLQEQFQ